MSRFTGPQQRGAGRQARVEKRAAAEVRQREEREREAKRRAEMAKWPEPELSEAEVGELIAVVAALRLGEAMGLKPRWERRRSA